MPPDPTTPDKTLPRLLAWAMPAVLLAATFAAYFPALRGTMVWDDDSHVTAPWLRGLSGLRRIWLELGATQQYYPVLHSAFWFEHRMWGDSVLGYHAANVVLHVLGACLFAHVLARIRPGAEAGRLPGRGDWLAAAIFALHPVCAESVAWISEQKNTLSLVFYLLSALAYLRFDRGRGLGCYAVAFGLFVLALLSKSVTGTLPAALLLVLVWRRGGISWRRDVVPLLPFFAAGLAFGLLTAWVERNFIGARGGSYDLGFAERLFLAGRVVWFYLGKLLWPFDLSFIYERWHVAATAAWSVGLAGVAALAAVLWTLRRRAAAPLVGFLFFVGSLFPALGFFNVYPFIFSYVADHWQYLPSLGIFALAGGGLSRASRTLGLPAAVFGALCVALLGLLLGLTRRQAALYRDVPTLYSDTIAKNPDCWMAHGNLGVYLMDQGSTDLAIAHFKEAVRIRPDYADAHNNLGNALSRTPGGAAEAIAQFREAIRLNPAMDEAHANLALALVHEPGSFNEGVAEFRLALKGREADPRMARVHADLGMALAQARDGLADAVKEERLALALDPGLGAAHYDLGVALGRQGHTADAVVEYRSAMLLGVDTAQLHNGLGSALMRDGESGEASREFASAVALAPSSAALRNNLGIALMQLGRLDEAMASLREAVRLSPKYPDAHYNLALALRRSGRKAEAQAEFAASGRPQS
ncbi:MAG TPA: tetratricopeptide repeat protein [Opitutaceae bacterium]|jgi:Flp pilus assembly protein TadD|nr:tetratricopeptide repeat protein [Opitutaceae bacterium]